MPGVRTDARHSRIIRASKFTGEEGFMNNVVFQTGGDWDTTTLSNNGQEVLASQLFVEVKAGRDAYGEPDRGGVFNGGEITAIIRTQEQPDIQEGIFPGRIEMDFPGHSI